MNKSILVVDDDKMLREALKVGLCKNGFDTIISDSAEDAFEILSRIKVDAIVLDRMMRGMDGLTFLKTLRSNGNQTPIIMLTALSGPENAIEGLAGGANDYLAKPFQLQELILRLNNITKTLPQKTHDASSGIIYSNDEFFVQYGDNQQKMLSLSTEERKLLHGLITPFGNIVPATPMVAKRLRNKINSVSSDIDIITVRGIGYKIINTKQ